MKSDAHGGPRNEISLIRFVSCVALLSGLVACTSYDYDKPDTSDNQKGFERHFGFPVPASVSDVYYFADELGADVKYQLGFKTDQATVDAIVAALELKQAEPEFGVGIAQEFPWWDKDTVENLTPYWKSNSEEHYYWFLWYDSESQRVYYIEFSV